MWKIAIGPAKIVRQKTCGIETMVARASMSESNWNAVSCLFVFVFVVTHQRLNNNIILASSFYPGRSDNSHVLARLDNHTLHTPKVDNNGFGTDEDSIDDNDIVELALKLPTKFSESLAIEVSLQRSTHAN